VLQPRNIGFIVRHMDISGRFGNSDISYYMVHQFNALPYNNAEVDFYDIEAFLKTNAASREIGRATSSYAKAIVRGNLDFYLTTDDIYDAAGRLGTEFHDLFDHNMTDADYEHFARTLADMMDIRGMGAGYVVEDYGLEGIVPFLRISSYLVWVVGVLCAVLLLILFMHHGERVASALLSAGIPIMLAGLVVLVVGVRLWFHPEILSDLLHDQFLHEMLMYTDGPAFLVIWHGVIFSAVGLLPVVACVVAKALVGENPP